MQKTAKVGVFIIIVNFLIYIGLGLPDSVLGSAWPAVRQTYHVNVDYVGYLTAISLVCSFGSTLLYPKLSAKHVVCVNRLVSIDVGPSCLVVNCCGRCHGVWARGY